MKWSFSIGLKKERGDDVHFEFVQLLEQSGYKGHTLTYFSYNQTSTLCSWQIQFLSMNYAGISR